MGDFLKCFSTLFGARNKLELARVRHMLLIPALPPRPQLRVGSWGLQMEMGTLGSTQRPLLGSLEVAPASALGNRVVPEIRPRPLRAKCFLSH